MQEYSGRASSFRTETVRHLWLAFGSLAAAALIGFPLGHPLPPPGVAARLRRFRC